MIDPKQVQKEADAECRDVVQVSQLVTSIQVKTEADLRTAVAMTAEIKDKAQAVDEKRTSWTGPLQSVIDDINSTFRPALDGLKQAEVELKDKMLGWYEGRLEEQEELLKSARLASSHEAMLALAQEAERLELPKIPGCSLRTSEVGQMLDPAAVNRWARINAPQLLVVDEKALKEYVKTTGVTVLGYAVEMKRTLAITPAKVVR